MDGCMGGWMDGWMGEWREKKETLCNKDSFGR